MKKNEFLNWAKKDGRLCTADGWKFIQIHKLESAFSQAYQDPAEWPGIIGRNFARLWGTHDVSISYTIHDEKPKEFFKDFGDDNHVSCSFHADGSQDITRHGETTHLKPGEEDPYGTSYTGGLFSFKDLEFNLLALERFTNEGILADRQHKEWDKEKEDK
jgi:hypothetical protein